MTTQAANPLAACQALLDAGKTLAALAEPAKDLISFASEFSEVGDALRNIARAADRAVELAEDRYDAIVDARQDHAAARRARAGDEARARDAALRGAKKALVDLARVIAELEAQATADAEVA